VVKLLALPLFILTLGLITLVINALMLLLTSWLADKLDLSFHVDGFWTAVLGALIVSIVSWALHVVLPDGED
jgi:putative membrane protein